MHSCSSNALHVKPTQVVYSVFLLSVSPGLSHFTPPLSTLVLSFRPILSFPTVSVYSFPLPLLPLCLLLMDFESSGPQSSECKIMSEPPHHRAQSLHGKTQINTLSLFPTRHEIKSQLMRCCSLVTLSFSGRLKDHVYESTPSPRNYLRLHKIRTYSL